MPFLLLFLLGLFCSCGKPYVEVIRERVGRRSLASTFVGSPDPLQVSPPHGQRLYIRWSLPSLVEGESFLMLSLLFRNYTREVVPYVIRDRRGEILYSLLDESYFQRGGLLAYKVEMVMEEDRVLASWKHRLWVDLIEMREGQADERPCGEVAP